MNVASLIEELGITASSTTCITGKRRSHQKVEHRTRVTEICQSLPMLVRNAAAFEGNTFTLPQAQTLLDEVTLGGKRIEEAEQILALSEAMELMANSAPRES